MAWKDHASVCIDAPDRVGIGYDRQNLGFLAAEQPERPCRQERFRIGALTVEYDETSKVARRARIAEARRFRSACIIDRVREDANAHEFRSSAAAIGEEADREPCDRHRPRIMMFPDERRGLTPGIDYIDGQGSGVDLPVPGTQRHRRSRHRWVRSVIIRDRPRRRRWI